MPGRSRRVTRRTGLLRRMSHVALLAVALLVVGMISVPATSAAATPLLKVRDTSVTETNSAGQVARIKVRLSEPATRTVKVHYRTVDGTATAPGDYRAREGTLRFQPGQRTRTVSVAIVGDRTDEADETFRLRLGHPRGAWMARRAGVVTIVDDDGPGLVVDNPTIVPEGGDATFKVSLAAPSTLPVSVSYATANGSAVGTGDYLGTTGTLPFAPGETIKTVTVTTVNDAVDEVDEYFYVHLSSPVNASIGDGTGFAFIDDDDGPAITVSAAGHTVEGGTAVFAVWLSMPSVQPVSVHYQTSNGSAVAPGDYTAVSGTLTFAPGQEYRTVEVTTIDDAALADDDEYFSLTLSTPVDASIAHASAVVRIDEATPLGTIRGDDGADVVEQTSTSTPAGDVDWYKFRLQESELGSTDDLSALVQLVVPEGGGDLDLYVYLADGTLVGSGVAGGTDDEAVPFARTDTAADDSIEVFVLVDQFDGTNGYTLRVRGNS